MVSVASKQSTCLPTLDDLSTSDLSTLRAWYTQLEGFPPPKSLKSDLLRAHLAWTVQALQQKENPPILRQRLIKKAQLPGQSPTLKYSPGTRLIREWQGQTHEVTILEKGYRYQGRTYRSLSQVAGNITGTHWSGPRFFGLNKHPARP
jgi:hypothetical protein